MIVLHFVDLRLIVEFLLFDLLKLTKKEQIEYSDLPFIMKVNKNLFGRKLLEKADNEKWGVKKTVIEKYCQSRKESI
jgi:hypothetical protein